jgi:tryptophan synthase beta chain
VTNTVGMGDPGATGRFGEFGGRYVPETLIPACEELEVAFRDAWVDPAFRSELELDDCSRDYAGRPSPLTECPPAVRGARLPGAAQARGPQPHRLAQDQQRARQALLARAWARPALVAETGAGQHGVATATAAALLGMECTVYMGEVDMARQELNVFRMRLLGPRCVPPPAAAAP